MSAAERFSEEYVTSLERRIADQRKQIRHLHERLRDGDEGKLRANKHARRRMRKLERVIALQAVKLVDQLAQIKGQEA